MALHGVQHCYLVVAHRQDGGNEESLVTELRYLEVGGGR